MATPQLVLEGAVALHRATGPFGQFPRPIPVYLSSAVNAVPIFITDHPAAQPVYFSKAAEATPVCYSAAPDARPVVIVPHP